MFLKTYHKLMKMYIHPGAWLLEEIINSHMKQVAYWFMRVQF